jgi:hypothetical protein
MASQSISASPSATLGNPTQRFEGGGGAVGAILGALLLGGLGAFFLFGTFAASGSRSSGGTSWGLAIVGLFLAGLGVMILFNWWKNRGVYVQVYTNGFARIQGTKVQEVRWDDIRAVWQSITKNYRNGVYMGTTYIYTVLAADNTKLVFGNEIKGIEQLGQLIQREATNRLFPRMVAAYNAGQPVQFGDFAISREGITHKNKNLPWSEIEGAQINNGFVTFKKQGKWFNWANVPVAQIPNMIVFLSLIDHVVGLKRGR